MADDRGEERSARSLDADVDAEALAERFDALANPRRVELLSFLTEPHYLEEIASHLGISRQAARRHLDRLVDLGALERRSSTRETGPVTEYVLAPEALFLLYDEIVKLGSLRPRDGASAGRQGTRHGRDADPLATPPPAPCLWVVRGLDAGGSIRLEAGGEQAWLVGRADGCDLVIETDPFVSTRHAEVWREGATFRITDLASTNGTRHNGHTLDRGEDAALAHGDVVEVGRTLLMFREA